MRIRHLLEFLGLLPKAKQSITDALCKAQAIQLRLSAIEQAIHVTEIHCDADKDTDRDPKLSVGGNKR